MDNLNAFVLFGNGEVYDGEKKGKVESVGKMGKKEVSVVVNLEIGSVEWVGEFGSIHFVMHDKLKKGGICWVPYIKLSDRGVVVRLQI